MTLDEHIAKWNGKGIDFDGVFGFQCMDSMHKYVTEVLGLTDPRILAAGVARQVFENFPNIYGNQYFDRIYNGPTNIPSDGDIIFWKEPYGYYFNTTTKRWEYAGHVGVSKGSNVNNVVAFEQNNPLNSLCHIEVHTDKYKGVLGWLHHKWSAPPVENPLVKKIADIRFACDENATLESRAAKIKVLAAQL